VKQKPAYAEHILRDSSGSNASLLLEWKLEGKKAGGRSQRTWIDDIDT